MRKSRIVQEKKRTRLNALKHGLFSKAVVLEWESQAEYLSLLKGLRADFAPHGTFEATLVENLAVLLWRKRRLFQAEKAEVSEKREFAVSDSVADQFVEAWDRSRAARASGGLLKHYNNLHLVQEAKSLFVGLRHMVIKVGFRNDLGILAKLYGQDQTGAQPFGLRLSYEGYATRATQALQRGDISEDVKLREEMAALIDREIESLTMRETFLETGNDRRQAYASQSAIVPGQEVSDRLLRYETHLTRETDRILTRLERLQRMRKGQPVCPQVDVNISALTRSGVGGSIWACLRPRATWRRFSKQSSTISK